MYLPFLRERIRVQKQCHFLKITLLGRVKGWWGRYLNLSQVCWISCACMFFCLKTFSETYALTTALIRIPCMYIWPVCLFPSADAELGKSEAFPVTFPCSLTQKMTVKMWYTLVSLRSAFQFWIIGKTPAPQIFSGLRLFRASVAAQQCLLKKDTWSFMFRSSVLCLLAHYFREARWLLLQPSDPFSGQKEFTLSLILQNAFIDFWQTHN